jgi:hypothetical protein
MPSPLRRPSKIPLRGLVGGAGLLEGAHQGGERGVGVLGGRGGQGSRWLRPLEAAVKPKSMVRRVSITMPTSYVKRDILVKRSFV